MGWVNFPWECWRLTHKACVKQLDRGLDFKYWDNLLFSWLFFRPHCPWVGIPSSGVSFATASLIIDGIRFWFFVSKSVEERNKIYLLNNWTTWHIFVFQLNDAVKRKWKCESPSRALPSATPWTVARHAPLSMGFSRQEILEWVAISSSRGSSRPRDRTWVFSISCNDRLILHHCVSWEAHACVCVCDFSTTYAYVWLPQWFKQ